MARKDLLSDESSSDSEATGEGAKLTNGALKVNEEYAKRFEHNKKREELQRLEDKFGPSTKKRKRDEPEQFTSDDESTSESEDEGELATEALDTEIIATINAIRSKDPRVYDQSAKFYSAPDEVNATQPPKATKEKSMTLQDYHRRNLLNGVREDEEDTPVLTYNQEQSRLKDSIVGEIKAAAAESSDDNESSDDEDDDGFLVAKEKPKAKGARKEPVLDVEAADKDPETFLSNFMSSRAWAAPADRNLVPFESDDEEEDRRADEFEAAYNLRFEDPDKANATLRSYARDFSKKVSVRREEVEPRQKKRELEKQRKEDQKQQMREEKARLRKLRIEQVEEKVRRIKRAAGLKSKDIQPEDWSRFVDEDWDDERWEQEMQQRFGDQYYAEQDEESDVAEGQEARKKPKKPKFDDDIDIKDIVPDFVDEEPAEFSLSDEEEQEASATTKSHKKQKIDKKKDAKRERRIIEQLVDDQLQYDLEHAVPNSSKTKGFRYRETSPKTFGLSSLDILLADDSQLNEFAGLKKLAPFRDEEKKAKDQKHLGKKARLRKWRKETFGVEEGLQPKDLIIPTASNLVNATTDQTGGAADNNIITKGKKKRRHKKNKTVEAV